eukprot:CAMPEP_0174256892 /NCGR_PEP_ID=MMETSP0439-20130205/6081_1 /TAXON_ID=0 /ORGANISM="Stereomyxa ramosa, Strain Chinc5" /LENGTH=247 /DNA_ID=CAMNT_0015339719 /DNA_START=59 /DNA_END=802 /DNA_ORIENTATION=-
MSGSLRFAVLGGSGAVGRALVKSLLSMPRLSSVTLLNRRELDLGEFTGGIKVGDSLKQVVVDMDKLKEETAKALKNEDAVFITLGVGAPFEVAKKELYHIDVELPTDCASAAKEAGVGHVGLLTSVGADPSAEFSTLTGTVPGGGWYRKCKGMVEKNILELGFDSTAIYRPAIIPDDPQTPRFFSWTMPALDAVMPANWNTIKAEKLGKAMATGALRAIDKQVDKKVMYYEGETLFELADKPWDKSV